VRKKLTLYPAVLAVVALGALLPGTAAAHGGKALKLRAEQLQFQYVDAAPPGTSVGDEFVFSEKLFERRRHVGMSGVVCTIVHATPPYDVLTLHCVATLRLRKGQIALQGLVELQGLGDPGPFTLAVTGGTGAYRGAGGEAVVRRGIRTVYKVKLDAAKKKQRSRGQRRH
jgi:hypothetical protein